MPDDRRRRHLLLAAAVLAYTVLVVLWGAYVRATGSGAGCGDHWPMCNGLVVPRAPEIATIIEYTHRLTSGLAWVLAFVLAWSARRTFPIGHLARRAANLGLFFMTTEALVGAGLVLFRMVADNDSLARGAWMAAHLVNTFLLLFALTAAVFFARMPNASPTGRGQPGAARVGIALVLLLAVGVTGAIAALGDTLFPATSLREGLREDFAPTAHLFVRLRMLHPLTAVVGAAYLLFLAGFFLTSDPAPRVRRAAAWVLGLTILQVGVGFLNLALLAPVPMQIVHLFVADAVWIALVWLWAEARYRQEEATIPRVVAPAAA